MTPADLDALVAAKPVIGSPQNLTWADRAVAAITELCAEVAQAREVAMIRHCDVNANGKTILDFHEVWLRQANERAERAESRIADLEREREAPPWRCGNCCQMNAGWARTCGRCSDDAAIDAAIAKGE